MAKAADYSLGPNTYPRGWFVIGESSDLDNGPLAVHFFGRDLALYRGESGKPVLLDAYCKHMGTHLTASDSAVIVKEGNQIEGDSIRCPYHGWRYAPDGKVDDIPYHDGPCPKSAAIQSYPVRDVMNCLMAWFDPDGGEPQYEPPFIKEWDDSQWVPWKLDILDIKNHPIEMLDNMADLHHLGPAHGAPCEFFETEIHDHIYVQRQGGFLKLFNAMLYTFTCYIGPGILIGKDFYNDMEYYHIIAYTPVDDGVVRIYHGALSKGENTVPNENDIEVARQIQAGALEALSADFSIWKNKKPALNIITLPNEGPFATGRKWYQQFFDKTENANHYQEQVNGLHTARNFPGAIDDYMRWEDSWVSPLRAIKEKT